MSALNVEDFKNVLLDLYLAQRTNAELRARIAALTSDEQASGTPSDEPPGG